MPLLINSLSGAAGGYLGNMLKQNGLGMVGNLLSGAVGGNALAFLVPMLMGNGDTQSMVTSIITSLVGGGAGSLIGGMLKKA